MSKSRLPTREELRGDILKIFEQSLSREHDKSDLPTLAKIKNILPRVQGGILQLILDRVKSIESIKDDELFEMLEKQKSKIREDLSAGTLVKNLSSSLSGLENCLNKDEALNIVSRKLIWSLGTEEMRRIFPEEASRMKRMITQDFGNNLLGKMELEESRYSTRDHLTTLLNHKKSEEVKSESFVASLKECLTDLRKHPKVHSELIAALQDCLDGMKFNKEEMLSEKLEEIRKEFFPDTDLSILTNCRDKDEAANIVFSYLVESIGFAEMEKALPEESKKVRNIVEQGSGEEPDGSGKNLIATLLNYEKSQEVKSETFANALKECLKHLRKNPKIHSELISSLQNYLEEVRVVPTRQQETSSSSLAKEKSPQEKFSDSMLALQESANSKVSASASDLAVMLNFVSESNVNSATSAGWTPLHFAAMFGQQKNVEKILRLKSDVNAKGEEGCSTLSAAASGGGDRSNIFKALLSQDLSLENIKDGLLTSIILGKEVLVKEVLESKKFREQITPENRAKFFQDLQPALKARQSGGKDVSKIRGLIRECDEKFLKSFPAKKSFKNPAKKAHEVVVSEEVVTTNSVTTNSVATSSGDEDDLSSLLKEIDQFRVQPPVEELTPNPGLNISAPTFVPRGVVQMSPSNNSKHK